MIASLATLTTLLAATLLFCVQPLWTRLVLPTFGGAAAVWTTAMLFFQVALLAGYGWVVLGDRLRPPTRLAVHIAAMAATAAAMPLHLPAIAAGGTPQASLLWAMALGVGLPFALLSATSPLLQRLVAGSDSPLAANPYPLYAVSNVGSLLGLLGWPLLVEPAFALPVQVTAWNRAFVMVIVGVGLLGVRALARPRAAARVVPDSPPAAAGAPISTWRWACLAAVPAALSVAQTTWLAHAIASVPLVWVLPLAAYLLSFVLAFGRRGLRPARWQRATATLVPAALMLWLTGANSPWWLVIAVHVAAMGAVATQWHGRLAAARPDPRDLAKFYLAQAAGGVAGGAVASLGAPMLLADVAEYPALLALAAPLALAGGLAQPAAANVRATGVAALLRLGGVGVAAAAILAAVWSWRASQPPPVALAVGSATGAAVALALWALSRRPPAFAVVAAAVVVVGLSFAPAGHGVIVARARSFYGAHRVTDDAAAGLRQLWHGATAHGRARLPDDGACTPLLYYAADGPAGSALRAYADARPLAAVGLGSGSLACYARPGQELWGFEIDPEVIALARSHFPFLSRCQGPVHLTVGDARLTLAAAPAAHFGALVLDAYASDAVPQHLLTREAFALFRSRVAPGGLMLAHISNRHFDLAPPLARHAADAGWQAWSWDDADVPAAATVAGRSASRWMMFAAREADVAEVLAAGRWRPAAAAAQAWTDEWGSLWTALSGW